MDELKKRRESTLERIRDLQKDLGKASDILASNACVYATGSFGRLEARPHSDLDLFIVGRKNGRQIPGAPQASLLRRLDEIRIKAEIIEATKRRRIPEFDKDGYYFRHFSVSELTTYLGTPEDDLNNTFTARLLLLLESTPILGQDTYRDIVDEVITPYFRDYEKHKEKFVPAYLANDIIRLWRTFCVNYEARTKIEPEEKRIERKTKNFKLKCSRMLTCFSALIFLLSRYENRKTVLVEDVVEMMKLTPTQRLQQLLDETANNSEAKSLINILNKYNQFLEDSNFPDNELIARFHDDSISKPAFENASAIGEGVFNALNEIGKGSRFHRLLMV